MQNIQHLIATPSTKATNSPKSTSASSPGPWVWGTVTRRKALSSSRFTWAT